MEYLMKSEGFLIKAEQTFTGTGLIIVNVEVLDESKRIIERHSEAIVDRGESNNRVKTERLMRGSLERAKEIAEKEKAMENKSATEVVTIENAKSFYFGHEVGPDFVRLYPEVAKKLREKVLENNAKHVASFMKIKDVVFNPPATIVFWADGTKSVVKAQNEDFDPEKGLAMAIARKALGNKHSYFDTIRKYTKKFKAKDKGAN